MQLQKSGLRLGFANLCLLIALAIFAKGFFPYKAFIPGHASRHARPDAPPAVSAPFNKVIFMVVDALRSDFVYSGDSGFEFVQSLIRDGAALPYTAHANPPTITMPRIKALSTGSVPSFLNVILNFAESDTTSSLSNQDTWLSQLNEKGTGGIVLYGDDTWLKLFPETFMRADGTTSFFVSDFTEVDNNVTRHVLPELQRPDWNGMILHYLGLDHIGHKSGPRSIHMKPKQSEMDHIISQIYAAMQGRTHLDSTLLILTGDHGMNDGGNHGGGAAGETSPALVLMSPKFRTITAGLPCPAEPLDGIFEYFTAVEQSDIVPTLAGLLGFPVPLNNIGVFMPEVLSLWDEDQQLQLIHQNAEQIWHIVENTYPPSLSGSIDESTQCDILPASVERLSCLLSRSRKQMETLQTSRKQVLRGLRTFCWEAQRFLSNAATNYDVSKLALGIAVAAPALFVAMGSDYQQAVRSMTMSLWIFMTYFAFGISMFASSYIEEEHQFWYWIGSAWLAWLTMKSWRSTSYNSIKAIATSTSAFLVFRTLRSWNQTGQKWAGSADVAKAFLPHHTQVLWALVLGIYAFTTYLLIADFPIGPLRPIMILLAVILGLVGLVFKLAFTCADAPELLPNIDSFITTTLEGFSLVVQARTIFTITLALALLLVVDTLRYQKRQKTSDSVQRAAHHVLTFLLLTQSRTANTPLFLAFHVIQRFVESSCPSDTEITFTSLVFQYVGFFSFGGSNAISSIDLSNGYNGVGGYNVIGVGLLIFSKRSVGSRPTHLKHTAVLTIFYGTSILTVMLACVLLRTHLFIWTVFSPKYLYTLAWFVGQHLCVNVAFGNVLDRIAPHKR